MKLFTLLLGAAIAWGQQTLPPADPTVITIGSEKITKSQFELIVASLNEQQRAQAQTPAGKRRLAEQISELKVLAQDARQRKLDQNPRAQTLMALQTDQVLAQLAFQDLSNSSKPDDAALHAYYDAHKQDWETVKARHILIRMQGSRVPLKPNEKDLTDAEALAKAQELRAKIAGGTDFAEVAKAESDDTGNAPMGGVLDPFGRGSMVKEFETAAFGLEVGKLSEPVKTAFGYHLIMVDAHDTKPFEGAKGEIEQKMKPEMAQKGLEALKKKTAVVYDDGYFGK